MESNQTNRLWNILMKNIDWIKFSDTKATVVLTVYGIIITLVYTNSSDVLNSIQGSNILPVLTILAGFLSTISIIFSFICLSPKLSNNNPSSVIYFGHIQKFKSYQKYLEEYHKVLDMPKDYEEQIAEQVYTTSKIAWRKFYNVSWAIRLLIFTILTLLSEVLIYLSS